MTQCHLTSENSLNQTFELVDFPIMKVSMHYETFLCLAVSLVIRLP